MSMSSKEQENYKSFSKKKSSSRQDCESFKDCRNNHTWGFFRSFSQVFMALFKVFLWRVGNHTNKKKYCEKPMKSLHLSPKLSNIIVLTLSSVFQHQYQHQHLQYLTIKFYEHHYIFSFLNISCTLYVSDEIIVIILFEWDWRLNDLLGMVCSLFSG